MRQESMIAAEMTVTVSSRSEARLYAVERRFSTEEAVGRLF